MLQFLEEQGTIILQSVLALYIVVNPSGIASVFLGITKDLDKPHRRSVAFRAVIAGGVVLIGFAVAGSYLFRFFRITGASLQIAGGILVFGFAYALARGKEADFFGRQDEAKDRGAPGSVAYYPLAVPMIAGPASITVVISLTPAAADAWGWSVLVAAIGSVLFLTLLSMFRVLRLEERLGPGLGLVWPRIMGLFLAVIAVQLIIDGIAEVLPKLIDAVNAAREVPA